MIAAAVLIGPVLVASPAHAVTTGNGSLVYAPPNGSSFNDEGGDATGTAYAKVLALKHSGAANGTLIATFDDARLIQDVSPSPDPVVDTQACLANPLLACHQEWPIFESTDDGATWQKISAVDPGADFPGIPGQEDTTQLDRTAQPFLYELPQAVGDLPAGTILLTGQIRPADRDDPASVSKLVVYSSSDHGASWSYLSTIDTGGPAVYDPSPTSTTTTVWEPTLAIDAYGGLVAYFSDERQKADGVLQAISYRRSTDGGLTWGALSNVSAPTDNTHRPGMITVDRLPDGSYIATYEVVNAVGYAHPNASPVFFKTSPDGLDWGTTTGLGTPVELADGSGIGSSPFVKWVPTGGPKGMIVVASKWGLDPAGNVYQGQNFFVNYNLGAGPWERLPFAVTFDGPSSITGFAQGIDYSPDGRTLYQATNVDNYRPNPSDPSETYMYNDIRVGTVPLNAIAYEAENATLSNVSLVTHADASNGSKVGDINFSDSTVAFTVDAPASGTYTVNVRYANGMPGTSSHAVRVNGGSAFSVSYPPTAHWGRYLWAQFTTTLAAGANTIQFGYQGTYAEIDQIQVFRSGVTPDPEFHIVNRNSGKLLEVLAALTTDGAAVGQWGPTNNPTQVWQLQSASSGTHHVVNKNSHKLLEIPGAATADGVDAVQWGPTGNATQRWDLDLVSGGFWQLVNANSGKLLEIDGCSPTDGAVAQQWGPTAAACQDWRLVKEGIQ
ncbi:RICIN domain-containing protein [Agromyces silvae]|uniref:RICIN domain-containing protein n=1 Tax=Agromyces silvae TaxID=3388266 RepID=UPI00280A7E6B|nr:RICIN domain-containing protein [Agromyces protaetiae]